MADLPPRADSDQCSAPPVLAQQKRSTKSQTPSEQKLFTPAQIAVAAFLGSPLPAFYLLSANYRTLGQTSNARSMLIVGFVVTILVTVIAFRLPDDTPNSLIPILYTVCAHQIAKIAQGPFIHRHTTSGGLIASWWRVIGYGVLGLVLVLAVSMAVVFALPE